MSNPPDDVRVMIVDDHDSFRTTAREMVDRMAGFAVIAEAASGEESVALAAQVRPALVVMDINMGAMDGIEATARITADRPATVVVLVSTYDLADLPAAALTSGAAAYLNKDEISGRALRRIWESGGDPAFARTGHHS